MANGMSSLYVGASGLQSAQTGLNTTAHNLANINTKGYSRQQVLISDSTYLKITTLSGKTEKYGLGVAVNEINRIRDQFIDEAYRKGNSRLGYYSSQYDALEEVEGLFGELQGVTFQSSIDNLKTALGMVKMNPTSTVARSSVLQYASAFLTQANAIHDGLKDYQSTLNTKVETMVDKINSLGNTIFSLNKQISKIESNGVEKANDLRDQRDKALDELSGYIKITYYEGEDNQIRVNAEGAPFVIFGGVNEMSTRRNDENGLLIPNWPVIDSDVFSDNLSIYDKDNGDAGQLKGLMVARGIVDVNYTDVPVKPNEKDYDMTTDEGKEKYKTDMAAYQQKQDYYNTYIEPSVVLSAMAGLDKLVNGMVTTINDILCPETTMKTDTAMKDADGNEIKADQYSYQSTADKLYTKKGVEVLGTDNGDGTYSYESDEKLYTDEDGKTAATVNEYIYSVLDLENTGYGMDEDKTVGQELFTRKGTDRYITSKDASGNTVYIRNNLNERNHVTDYTLGDIEMNAAVLQKSSLMPLSTKTGAEDMDRAAELYDVWSKDFGSLNPEQYATGDLDTYYNNFIGDFATIGKVLDNFVTAQDKMVSGYDNQRISTSGVSSDEELEKMIRFQQSYNAASRYVNVVSEMLEHLVTSLGRA